MTEVGPTPGERSLRIAFVTPEFPTEKRGAGGVGSYVHKMARILQAAGHSCTVFVISATAGRAQFDGLEVVKVASTKSLVVRGLARALRRLDAGGGDVILHVTNARHLAAALEREHRTRPFDLVQSANYHLSGLFVRRTPGRAHLIRISTSRVLYDPAYGRSVGWLSRLTEQLDVVAQRRADQSYAPSRLLQLHFARRYGLNVALVRPPMPTDVGQIGSLPSGPEPPYLVHFGSLGARKGTDVVAAALPHAWQVCPELKMVWVGPISETALAGFRQTWGEKSSQVEVLGPLDKPELYAVVANATASVLPSRMDNLPNTVIESLALGVPVIGSDGASIDELVVDRSNGLLVPIGDARALADAMVQIASGTIEVSATGIPVEMEPANAVNALLELAAQHVDGAGRRRDDSVRDSRLT